MEGYKIHLILKADSTQIIPTRISRVQNTFNIKNLLRTDYSSKNTPIPNKEEHKIQSISKVELTQIIASRIYLLQLTNGIKYS